MEVANAGVTSEGSIEIMTAQIALRIFIIAAWRGLGFIDDKS